MKSIYLAATALLSIACQSSPHQRMNAFLEIETRQSPGSYYAITGATGGVHPRLEIRELQKTKEMWNLYLLAMREFQAMDQNRIDSWYQIAGIHGMPWMPWDGVEGNIGDKPAYQRGYCPHNMLLFGTWHRPYLALFEQQLQKLAINIASKFPKKSRPKYQDAARKLRLPFWDWAKALPTLEDVLPTATTMEKVNVTFTDGTFGEIDNPLFDYNFNQSNGNHLNTTEINGEGCETFGTIGGGAGGIPYVCEESPMTIRMGDKKSDHSGLNIKLHQILDDQRTSVLTALSQYQPFDAFSNDGNCGTGRIKSIENAHNPIRAIMFPGHMSPASVSAFDPIFWLHHANVDRQIALFQALFPDTYVGECTADTATYTIEKGEMLDANSPLTPFHRNAQGDWWTSANSRYIQDMGYTYPELVNNPSNATLVAHIKSLYAGPANASTSMTKRQEAGPVEKELYLAEVNLPLYGRNGGSPYNVLIFLSDVPSNSKEWLNSESFVGMISTMGGNTQSAKTTTATLDLSHAMERKGVSGNTTEYLKKNLHFRLELGEVEIPRTEVSGLKVSLISTKVEIATSDDVFDRWVGGFIEHGEVDV